MATTPLGNGFSVTIYRKSETDAAGQIFDKNNNPIGTEIVKHGRNYNEAHDKTLAAARAIFPIEYRKYILRKKRK